MTDFLRNGIQFPAFQNLFVLEMANNHWGSLDRAKRIVDQYAESARWHELRVAMKLQIRDVENFIHRDFRGREDIRYIWKTEATEMSREDYSELVEYIKWCGLIPMATAFDEASVDFCQELGLEIMKVASSDHNDWPLIEKVASTGLPVIISSGGASEKALDDVVNFFNKRRIPLAINHCVSLYPSEDSELELSQITWLRERYPNNIIGFSSHEQHDWTSSMFLSYALGARTWERHVDIEDGDYEVSPYCSKPEDISAWFGAFNKAKEMVGNSHSSRRPISEREVSYLNALVRGVYAKRDIPPGTVISSDNFNDLFYLAVPLQKSQISTREVRNGLRTVTEISAHSPLRLDNISADQFKDSQISTRIQDRGI